MYISIKLSYHYRVLILPMISEISGSVVVRFCFADALDFASLRRSTSRRRGARIRIAAPLTFASHRRQAVRVGGRDVVVHIHYTAYTAGYALYRMHPPGACYTVPGYPTPIRRRMRGRRWPRIGRNVSSNMSEAVVLVTFAGVH